MNIHTKCELIVKEKKSRDSTFKGRSKGVEHCKALANSLVVPDLHVLFLLKYIPGTARVAIFWCAREINNCLDTCSTIWLCIRQCIHDYVASIWLSLRKSFNSNNMFTCALTTLPPQTVWTVLTSAR